VSAPPLLVARAVWRRFGRRTALYPTDLELGQGELVALVGPNGAGKSTLLSILAGALPASGGRVELRGDVRCGWMPQRPAHYGRLSARENLELFARLQGEADPAAAAARLLAQVELSDEDRASADLSLGNRQRLNLALALLGDPNVLLLDEPAASLDPRQRRRLWETVLALRAAGGAACIATQHPEELEPMADRVAVLVDGRLVFSGSPGDYRRSPLVGALR
jgi:ABC-2 type transport system ATP-binding protein